MSATVGGSAPVRGPEGPDSPGVRFPPPIIFVVGFVAGWMLHRAWALPILPGGRVFAAVILGWAAIVAGLGLMLWALVTFARARTAILPSRPARGIVTSGPYRFTRNPMYVGLAVAYVGFALLVNSVWPIALLPIVIALLTTLVIRREEHYLASAFGPTYAEYTRRVGRWL